VLERSIVDMRRELNDVPRAVLIVSGHRKEETFTLSSAERPGMMYGLEDLAKRG
jgi:hypothetical protein